MKLNLRNYKLVEFANGKFGIRKGWLFHTFLDFKEKRFWWGLRSEFYYYCMVDKTTAETYFKNRFFGAYRVV